VKVRLPSQPHMVSETAAMDLMRDKWVTLQSWL
jgi:hypothetical protein